MDGNVTLKTLEADFVGVALILENTMLSCQSCFPCHSDADAPSEADTQRRHTPACDRDSEPHSYILQRIPLHYVLECVVHRHLAMSSD